MWSELLKEFIRDLKAHRTRAFLTLAAITWGTVSFVRMLPAEDGPMQFLGRPVLSASIMVLPSGILMLIGLLAGFFPARKAARVDPVESLRYE